MNPLHVSAQAALKHWPSAAQGEVRFLNSANSFSGAQIWHVTAPSGEYALRRWPAKRPGEKRLVAIHRLQNEVAGAGIEFVPKVISARDSESLVRSKDELWQLETWRPGLPYPEDCLEGAKLAAAAAALARFHLAARSSMLLDELGVKANQGPAPTFSRRHELAAELLPDVAIQRMDESLVVQQPGQRHLADEARRILMRHRSEAVRVLATWAGRPMPLAWRHGDARCEHFLFHGGQVSGLVDFAAAGIDAPVGDLVRLLATGARNDGESWQTAVQSYDEIRPLEPAEREALDPLHWTGLLLAAANWLRWLLPGPDQLSVDAREAGWRRLGVILDRFGDLQR